MNGEIVSADSMQIYKGLDITTAKPTPDELAAIPHHLVGVIDSGVSLSVADYVPLAQKCLDDIISRGKIPIIVGGTGLYISAIRDGIDFSVKSSDINVRRRLERDAEIHGKEYLWRRLNELDHESAEHIPPANIIRIIRALEIIETTGLTFSEYRKSCKKGNTRYNFSGAYIDFADRAVLYARINERVDRMLDLGMVEECKTAYDVGIGGTLAQAIGYKELFPYFEGELSLGETVGRIKQSTRRYAKRQLTWFRHDDKLSRIEIAENDPSEKNFNKIYEFFSKQ
jgi:tRNA dimethylallyltransferase